MKERPIIFSAEMVRAILTGKKTQTRRVCKEQPRILPGRQYRYDGIDEEDGTHFIEILLYDGTYTEYYLPVGKCRYGEVGDLLWVRETWIPWDGLALDLQQYFEGSGRKARYLYRADIDSQKQTTGWSPSRYMPRAAARLFLRVKNVRVERLQDISEEDAIAEGIDRLFDHLSPESYKDWAYRVGETAPQSRQPYKNYLWHGHFGRAGTGNRQSAAWSYQYSGYAVARDSFSSLWELINAKYGYSWNVNPWVWAIEFEVIANGDPKEIFDERIHNYG
jgi:hypothetical protein